MSDDEATAKARIVRIRLEIDKLEGWIGTSDWGRTAAVRLERLEDWLKSQAERDLDEKTRSFAGQLAKHAPRPKSDSHHWRALTLALDDTREAWRRQSLLVAECRRQLALPTDDNALRQRDDDDRLWLDAAVAEVAAAGVTQWLAEGRPTRLWPRGPDGALVPVGPFVTMTTTFVRGRHARPRAQVGVDVLGVFDVARMVAMYFRAHGGERALAERLDALASEDPAIVYNAADAWFSTRRHWQPVCALGTTMGLEGASVSAIERHAGNAREAREKAVQSLKGTR